MNLTDISQQFSNYVIGHNFDELLEIMARPDPVQHYSLIVNFVTLFEENIELGNAVLSASEKVLPIFDQGLTIAQKNVLETVIGDNKDQYSVKEKLHARVTGLPSTSEGHRTVFPKNEELGNFLKVSGTVVKVTLPKLLEYEREYICSKCQSIGLVPADFNLCHAINPPKSCINSCVPANFTAVKSIDGGRFKDYQELKVQEEVGKLHMGSIPSSIWITVDNDLVDTCHPGDHITVWGTVMRRWRGLVVGGRQDVELVVKANNLQVTNHQKTARLVTVDVKNKFNSFWDNYKHRPLVGRDIILASFCPNVYGLYLVKLAMCVVLSGGVPRTEEGGSYVRAESHLLLVGDPGTGKSHLLRFAAKTSTRSVLTTGVGSTSAGLTVCAVREGSDWQLEAGALVLADGGVCCIDELSSIREQDRASIHEAMEQQTISVAKAGMVTKLNSRCSVLAATNPKGAYDPSQSLSVNVALASPLLSRFDLVLILQDTRNQDWDILLSNFILGLAPISFQSSPDLWSIEDLRNYFALVKTYHPAMSPDANAVLCRYYQAQRGADGRNAARTTVRMLESLVRLSQGHARLMLREEVTVQDAIVAVTLVECSMAASALIATANALHAAFPENPQKHYRHQAELVLTKLHLEKILEKEVQRLEKETAQFAFEEGKEPEKPPETANDDQPGPAKNFSERLSDILTGIRKKKDRDMYQAASLTGKRRLEPIEAKRNRKIRKISEDDEDCERNILEEGEEPNKSKMDKQTPRRLQKISEEDEGAAEVVTPQKEAGDKQSLSDIHGKRPELRKPLQSTIEKLLAFKKTSRPDHSSEGSVLEKEIDNERVNVGEGTLNDSIRGDPVITSTPFKSTSSNLVINTQILDSTIKKGTELSTTLDVVALNSNQPAATSTLNIPTPLLTPHERPKGYDRNKLQALARLGKSLSQSQSRSQTLSESQSSQTVVESSQFSLHEMPWDDLELEL